MSARILRIETRRTIALWAGGVFAATALAFLYLFGGPWWQEIPRWTAQWSSAAQWERKLLTFLWPMAVGAGALQGLRDHRSRMTELLGTTPRRVWQRAGITAGALALLLMLAYLVVFLVAGVQVIGSATYFHLGWVPMLLVGMLALVAGGWLGMGISRAVPSALTPPVLAVAALGVSVVFDLSLGAGSSLEGSASIQVALLGPALPDVRDVFSAIAGSVSLGQACWFAGLAGTGFLLFVSSGLRSRLLAVLPGGLGAVVALSLLPSGSPYVVDKAAEELVCSGPVCVTRLHEARLSSLVGPGQEALKLLSVLPDPPRSVHETVRPLEQRNAGIVGVDFRDWGFQRGNSAERTLILLAGAGTLPCLDPIREDFDLRLRETAARTVAAAWFTGELKPLRGSEWQREQTGPLITAAWEALRSLPADVQRARIVALRAASLSCQGDLLDVLNGGRR